MMVALTVVGSKAVVMLLLNYCFVVAPPLSLLRYAMLSVHPSFTVISLCLNEGVALLLLYFLLPCDC